MDDTLKARDGKWRKPIVHMIDERRPMCSGYSPRMTFAAQRGPLLQLASVVASAAAAIFAKLALDSFSLAQFLLIFACTSVLACAPLLDRASLRAFLSARTGWLAIGSNAVALSAFYFGLNGLDPGTHAFLSRTYVAFGFVLSFLLFREPFGPSRLIPAVLCVLSALCIATPAQLAVDHWRAVGATILSACLYALNYALLRMAPVGMSPPAAIFLYNAAILLLALTQVDVPAAIRHVSKVSLGVAAVSAILSVLSLHWYIASAREVTFFLSTAIRATSPFMVALLALPWFPMTLSTMNVIGVVAMPCVLIAIAVLERGRRN